MSDQELKQILMTKHKETIINLYLSAKPKADKYDQLKELLSDMLYEERSQ
jgi:hypothetical protein